MKADEAVKKLDQGQLILAATLLYYIVDVTVPDAQMTKAILTGQDLFGLNPPPPAKPPVYVPKQNRRKWGRRMKRKKTYARDL